MRILLIGAGTVGEAIAKLTAHRGWCEQMVVADHDLARAVAVTDAIAQPNRFEPAQIDAADTGALVELVRAHRSELVMNAVDPQFVMPVFRAALAANVHYLDMATSLSKPDPDEPFSRPGLKLADEQFAMSEPWERSGKLALLGMGMDPGLTDVFAAYAAKHLFDEIHEVHVRDGGDLRITGYDFAPGFQHLDDDRGVPQPAGGLGGRGMAHHRAVQRAGAVPVPGGHRSGRMRQRRARGGPARAAPHRRQAGHL